MSNVICIALHGYAEKWAACISSQRIYCARNNYNYIFLNNAEGSDIYSAGDSKWLKLELLVDTLAKDSGWTMVLDADAFVMPGCPPMNSVLVDGKSVYMVMGRSNRYNSGVIIVRSCTESQALFKTILVDRKNMVEPEHFVSIEGENGHIIKHTTDHPAVAEISRKWNNTMDPRPDDYVRHFTGPMRQYYHAMTTGRTRSV